jgi:hypothetical protein
MAYIIIILGIIGIIYIISGLISGKLGKSNFENTCDIMPQSCVASGTWALSQVY